MTTIAERTYSSTIGAGSRQWGALLGRLQQRSPWLIVAAYATVYAGLLVGAGLLALSLAAMLPGLAGVVVFFTVGLALIGAAPTVARLLFTRSLDQFDDRQQVTSHSDSPTTDSTSDRTDSTSDRTDSTSDRTDSTSDRILVVLDFDDPAATLRAVMADPDTVDAEFHLLVVFPTGEYEARREARIDAGVTGPYTIDHLTEEARREAQRVGRAYLDTDDSGFETMGAVGRTRDYVSEAVRTLDYRRVYVAERPRPVWQRLLGVGDISTELVRALPDVVTVVPAADVLDPAREGSDDEAVFDPEAEPTPRRAVR